ncbi:Uncharacterised protein [Mycobacterium tuberculosis]|nr:Uncharacterised protein [Mycobacterium tuberculosis]
MGIPQVASQLPAQVRIVSYKFLDEVAHPAAFSQASTISPGNRASIMLAVPTLRSGEPGEGC